MLGSFYAEAFIDSTLKTDAVLTGATALNSATRPDKLIFRNRARQGTKEEPTPFPLIIYNLYTADDWNGQLNQNRIFSEYLFQCRVVGEVKGVDLQDADRVRASANRMDDLLKEVRVAQMTIGIVTYFFNVWRESELVPREEEGDDASTFYRNYGGLYRVQVFD